MIRPGLRLERLGPQHDTTTFTSGKDTLDGWIRRHGLAAQDMESARTFVLVGDGSVIGYFSLTMGSVRRGDAPTRLVRAMPACPVGMALLARLAVHRLHQGEGHGALLLAEALRKAVVAGDAAAAQLMVVDPSTTQLRPSTPITGSSPYPNTPCASNRRMKDVRASLTAAG